MKSTTFKKKLLLNKKTIASLEIKELEVVYGGATQTCEFCVPPTRRTCPTQSQIVECPEC
jgi:hypothetical protein